MNMVLLPFVLIAGIAGLVIMLRSMIFKKSRQYPSLAYFASEKRRSGHWARLLKNILKIALFILFCISIAMFLKGGNSTEGTLLIIEMTPRIERHFSAVDSIISSMADSLNISGIERTAPGIAPKQEIISSVLRKMHILSSDRVMLITDRHYDGPFTIISPELPQRTFTVTGAGNLITLHSTEGVNTRINLFLGSSMQWGDELSLVRGYNVISMPYGIAYDSISINGDGVKLYEPVHSDHFMVNDKTGSKFISYALSALGYGNNEGAELKLSFDDNVSKGIVFSQYGRNHVKEGQREYHGYGPFGSIMMRGLQYERLDEYSGEVMLRSDIGEKLIVREGDVFYVNIPSDTGMSNFFMLPEWIVVLDVMINELNNKHSGNNALLLQYQRESMETGKYAPVLTDTGRGSNHTYGLIAIILMMLLLML